MTRSMRALTFLVAVGFAVPAVAGQAVPRTSGGTATASSGSSGGGGNTGGSSSSSSGSSGSSGSSSSGGSSGPTSASGRSMFGDEFRSTPSRISSGNTSRTGTAAVRTAPAPGGISMGGSSSESESSSRVGAGLTPGDSAFARSRSGQPITGLAAPRPLGQIGGGGGDLYVSFPFYGPWGYWYPWYSGFGYNMGFNYYNPWHYGATSWYWSPYGIWYDPAGYWDPFWSGGYSRNTAREREPRVKEEKTTGGIRLKANPGSAKVYIDKALVGTVDDFNGLNDHLEIAGGRHTIELVADGYITQSQEINVKVGTTQTIRISLKVKK